MVEIDKLMTTILHTKKIAVATGVKLHGYFDMQVRARVSAHSLLRSGSMGTFSFAQERCELQNCTIGRYCSIDTNVSFAVENHPGNWLTSSPILCDRLFGDFSDDPPPYDFANSDRIHVGHDVWIGRNVTIMPGVRIGTGAIISPNSVVTSNVEPYSMCAGTPACHKQYRFTATVIDLLLDTPWYNFDIPKWNQSASMPDLREMNENTARTLRDAVRSGDGPLLKDKTYRFSETANGALRLSKRIP